MQLRWPLLLPRSLQKLRSHLEAVVVPPSLLQVQDITQVYGSVVQELQLPEKGPDAVGHGG